MRRYDQDIKGDLLKLSMAIFMSFGLATPSAKAQQDAIYSQYMFNNVVVNPATAGLNNQVSAILLYKRQWVSMPGAPRGQSFSLDGPIKNKTTKNNLGIGLHFVGDQFGPNKNTGVFGSVAYKFKLGQKSKLALGFRGGIKSYTINWGQIEYASGYKAGEDYSHSVSTATMGLGAHYFSKRGYIGLVVDNLTAPSLILQRAGSSPYGKLYTTTLLTMGYDFRINSKLNILPSLLFKGFGYQPETSTEGGTRGKGDIRINALFMYIQKYWIGLGITESGGNMLVGARLGKNIMLGLAFNSAASGPRSSTGSSQEIILGYNVKRKEAEVKLHLVAEDGSVIMIASKGKKDYFTFEKLPDQTTYLFKMESEDTALLAQTKEVEVRYKNADGEEMSIMVSKDNDEFFRYTFLPKLEEEKLFAINEAGDTVGVAVKNDDGFFVFEYLPNNRNLIFVQSDNIEETDMILSVMINDKKISLAKGDDTYFRFEELPPEVVMLYLLGDDGDTLGSAGLNADGFLCLRNCPLIKTIFSSWMQETRTLLTRSK